MFRTSNPELRTYNSELRVPPVPLLAKSEVFGTHNSELKTQNFVSRPSPYFLPHGLTGFGSKNIMRSLVERF